MTLDEQRDMIERALGERMLNHAFVVLHQWLQEIGFAMYGDRLQSLEQNYDALFQYYLSADDPDRDNVLDLMTGEVYRLVDDVYADLCIKRGRYPQLIGFNRENTQSVMNYFGSCVRLREEDIDWFREITIDQPQPGVALLVMASMLHVVRDCFSEDAILAIIDAIESESKLISDQALTTSVVLLAHYDVRIDYFPRLQERFVEVVGDGERVFQMILSMIHAATLDVKDIMREMKITDENLDETLQNLTDADSQDGELEHVISWIPKDENDYISGLTAMLPSTWVLEAVIGEDEERLQKLNRAYLATGRMDVWWDNLDEAEQVIMRQLRSEHPSPQAYLNYGHICFLRGDRLMAYENYREARRLFGSGKQFMNYFRPDRRFLIDRGIALEDVYLMEDQLLKA